MRRRRRTAAEEGTNHDRWLISYSDFVTLLFALFVVLFASGYRDNQAIIRVSTAVHNGFEAMGVSPRGRGPDPIAFAGAWAAAPQLPAPGIPSTDTTRSQTRAPAANLEQLREQLQLAMGDEIRNQEVELNFTPEGFVISLHDLRFFASGQADLLPGAAEKIKRIGRILASKGVDLRVEGHSDNEPIHNAQFHSNWELSTARAMAVLGLLVDQVKYDPSKISVAGYGQYRPIADNSTAAGRLRNRRVDLVVLEAKPPSRTAP